jgi:hypothetical protein
VDKPSEPIYGPAEPIHGSSPPPSCAAGSGLPATRSDLKAAATMPVERETLAPLLGFRGEGAPLLLLNLEELLVVDVPPGAHRRGGPAPCRGGAAAATLEEEEVETAPRSGHHSHVRGGRGGLRAGSRGGEGCRRGGEPAPVTAARSPAAGSSGPMPAEQCGEGERGGAVSQGGEEGAVFVSVWRGRRAWCFCRGETGSVFLS